MCETWSSLYSFLSDGPLLELSWGLPVQTLQRYGSHSGIQKDGFGRHSCKGIYKSQRTGQPEKQIASGHGCPLCGGLRAKRMTNKADDYEVRLTHKKGRKNIRKARRGQWIRTEGARRSTFKAASTGFEGSSLAADLSEPKAGRDERYSCMTRQRGRERNRTDRKLCRGQRGTFFKCPGSVWKRNFQKCVFHRDAVFSAINWLKALCW